MHGVDPVSVYASLSCPAQTVSWVRVAMEQRGHCLFDRATDAQGWSICWIKRIFSKLLWSANFCANNSKHLNVFHNEPAFRREPAFHREPAAGDEVSTDGKPMPRTWNRRGSQYSCGADKHFLLSEILCNKALKNPRFARNASLLCDRMAWMMVEGTKFRSVVLNVMQVCRSRAPLTALWRCIFPYYCFLLLSMKCWCRRSSTPVQFDQQHRRSQGVGGGAGAMPAPKFLANLVIFCFEKRRAKQKYCCMPEVKDFGPSKIWYKLGTKKCPIHISSSILLPFSEENALSL